MKKYLMFQAMLSSCQSIDDVLKVYDTFIKPAYTYEGEISTNDLVKLLVRMTLKIEEISDPKPVLSEYDDSLPF